MVRGIMIAMQPISMDPGMFALALVAISLAAPGGATEVPRPPVKVEYLHDLSTTTGVVRSSGVQVAFDEVHGEALTVGEGVVRVFNRSGMEVFRFTSEIEGSTAMGVAPLDDGDFLLLVHDGRAPALLRTNFRGEVKGRVELTGIPQDLPASFVLGAIGTARDRVYIANQGSMLIVATDQEGRFVRSYDLAAMLELKDKREDVGVRGFRVTPEGDLLFTVPTKFLACVIPAATGELSCFGTKGSAPGKFNIVTGIARDRWGNYYVADILKSAVLVFDRNFRWLKEFGYRGRRAGNLNSPAEVVVGDDKLYVSQLGNKGVAVFQLTQSAD